MIIIDLRMFPVDWAALLVLLGPLYQLALPPWLLNHGLNYFNKN